MRCLHCYADERYSRFLRTNLRAFLGVQVPLGADDAGYHPTMPLRETLEDSCIFLSLMRAIPG